MGQNYFVDCDDPSRFGTVFWDMPEVPPEKLDGIRHLISSHYVFYRRKRWYVEGVCSHCGERFHVDRYNELDDSMDELRNATHGAKGHCPHCGIPVTYKSAGRYRDFSTLTCYDNVIFILPVNNGQTVFFRCYTVFIEFSDEDKAHLCYVERAHYKLSPGEWQMERRTFSIYDCVGFGHLAVWHGRYLLDGYMGGWQALKRPADPWQGFMCNLLGYTIVDIEYLDETFLKYSHVKDFDQCRPRRTNRWYGEQEYGPTKLMAYLCYYAKYPSLEIAMRTCGQEAARDLIYDHRHNVRLVDWRAKTPLRFWRLTKEQYRATEGLCDRLGFLRTCRPYFGRLQIEQLVKIYQNDSRSVGNFFKILDMLPQAKATYVYRYCENHSRQYYGFYKDYLEAAAEIGRDLTVHNVAFPKNLVKAHDEAVRARQMILDAKKQAEWEEKARAFARKDKKRRQLYDYEADGYLIRVADNGSEIMAEGNALHHCVGGYVDRHLTCQTTILFLRRADAPTKPFYTVEMREGKLQQVHGDHNCAIDGEAKEFFDRWLDFVKAGGGLTHKNKQTSAKTQAAERKAV